MSKSARIPASSRRQKISMILQIAPLIDQISVLDGVVVPIVDVVCQKKFPAMVKVGLRDLFADVVNVYNRNMKHAHAIEFDKTNLLAML